MNDRLLQWFHLRRTPFSVDIGPEGLHRFSSFQQGFLRLEQATRQKSAMLVAGEPGTGKTSLARALSSRMAPCAYLVLDQLVPCAKSPIRAVIEGLLGSLGEPLPFNNPPRALTQLKRVLLDCSEKQQRTPVLILDDVHHFTQNCWLTLKSLMNYELDSRTPIILLLMGSPLALRTLNFAALAEVRDRFSSCYHLKGLLPEEVEPYLKHRLQWAGAERPLFPSDVVAAIAQHTNGLPRKVNRLANAALLTAAYRERELVDHDCLQLALSELQFQVVKREDQ